MAKQKAAKKERQIKTTSGERVDLRTSILASTESMIRGLAEERDWNLGQALDKLVKMGDSRKRALANAAKKKAAAAKSKGPGKKRGPKPKVKISSSNSSSPTTEASDLIPDPVPPVTEPVLSVATVQGIINETVPAPEEPIPF